MFSAGAPWHPLLLREQEEGAEIEGDVEDSFWTRFCQREIDEAAEDHWDVKLCDLVEGAKIEEEAKEEDEEEDRRPWIVGERIVTKFGDLLVFV